MSTEMLMRCPIADHDIQEVNFSLEDKDFFDEEEFDLLREAKSVLRYDPQEDISRSVATRESEQKILSQKTKLLQAMQALDVRPFDQKSVDVYKKKMVRFHSNFLGRHPSFARILRRMFDEGPGGDQCPWIVLMVIIGTLGAFIGISTLCLAGILSLWCLLLSFVPFLLCCLLTSVCENSTVRKAEWNFIRINEYSLIIPQYALQTAVDLKKQCPFIEVFVETLQVKSEELDPFLVIRDAQGNQYYLEVWSEPKFKGKRVA